MTSLVISKAIQTRGSRLHDSAQLHPRGTLHLECLQTVTQFYFLPTAHLLFDISFSFFFIGRQRGRKLQSRVNRVTLAAVSEAHRIFKQRTKAGRALDFTDSSARRGRKRNKTNDERDSSRHFRKEVLRRAGFTVAGESELFIFKTAGVHGFCFPLFFTLRAAASRELLFLKLRQNVFALAARFIVYKDVHPCAESTRT